jgi:hypothetical protein
MLVCSFQIKKAAYWSLKLVKPTSNITWMFFLQTFRQEAAGALWNLSFDDRNREAIAAAGGVEALVSLSFYEFQM